MGLQQNGVEHCIMGLKENGVEHCIMGLKENGVEHCIMGLKENGVKHCIMGLKENGVEHCIVGMKEGTGYSITIHCFYLGSAMNSKHKIQALQLTAVVKWYKIVYSVDSEN